MNQIPQESPCQVLIVGGATDCLSSLANSLTVRGYQVCCTENGSMVLREARQRQPNLIVLDLNLPNLDPEEVWEQLKADSLTNSIPLILLGIQDSLSQKMQESIWGKVDLIPQPFEVETILLRIENCLALRTAQTQIKSLNQALEQQIQAKFRVESANRILQQEIFQRDLLEEKLRHDGVTGLPNRSLFMERIAHCIRKAIADPNYQYVLLFIDLDRFRMFDDLVGHLAGNELLIACAQRLKNCLNDSTLLARLGGDEFTILLEQVNSVEVGVAIAQDILEQFTVPFDVGGHSLTIAASIGIVLGNGEYHQEIDLLRDADMALYRAKELGKARYEIFERQIYLDAVSRLELENELRQAIFQEELIVYYQPIVSLQSSDLIGFEALVRWQHPQKGAISPEAFIPLAEATGLIVPLGEWVMESACTQLKSWQDSFSGAKSLTMSINVAGEQLYNSDFLGTVDRILAKTQVDSNSLKFEITESMLIEDITKVIKVLRQIKHRNIRLLIDDFGTGYSSLSYLPQFPLDVLKIDRSFVKPMNREPQNLEIIKAIITLAQALNLEIIAEGIESADQLKQLQSLGVEFGQGLFFAPPLNAQLATDFICR